MKIIKYINKIFFFFRVQELHFIYTYVYFISIVIGINLKIYIDKYIYEYLLKF